MNIPLPAGVDFETLPIQARPVYPPEPVGVAIQWPEEQHPKYWRWGHPTGNNCDRSEAMFELAQVWESDVPIVFHHGKFDVAVAIERCGFKIPHWRRYHDTMFLAYLADPHNRAMDLKELARDFLNEPPDERDAIVQWVMAHADTLPMLPNKKGKLCKPSDNQRTKDGIYAGAWIAFAPGDLVDPYACGDVSRTVGLFRHLWPLIQQNGMGAAYDRERRFLPILIENERDGMRVNLEGLTADVGNYRAELEWAEVWMRQALNAPGLEFDNDANVAAMLLTRGIVPKENWSLTKTGKMSVAKDSLIPAHFSGHYGDVEGWQIASALGYRNRLTTCLNMFMEPWLRQASQRGGVMSTNWHQTRGGQGGTRTGRPSTSDPNWLNMSKTWDGRDDGYIHPEFLEVLALPLVRRYVLPDEGHVFLHRDFDGQELRLFADVECGDLKAKYLANPALDPHAFIGDELMRVAGREIERTKVKTLNFQGIYGGGVPALQRKLRCSTAEAKELKKFHDGALPGRKIVNECIKAIVRKGDPICTWGGRIYYTEPPGDDGRSKDYKLLNYRVQGSAADLTKEACVEWYEDSPAARFLVTVYDEINISAPIDKAVEEMARLKHFMEKPRLDVPMLSSPKHGPTWGDAKKCKPVGDCLLCA